jgi:ribA/ribD-fused uncharacterized protein
MTTYYINKDDEVLGWTNFSRHPVVIDGKTWPTTEHYFQAAKFFRTDPYWAGKILGCGNSPFVAKKMGNDRSHPINPGWNKGMAVKYMLIALLAKAEQHPALAKKLLDTGDATIVERADWDNIWGDGPNRDGANLLGKLCMIVRDVLKLNGGIE